MRTLKTLKPGQMGTKDLLARYGPTLLYLRYRCDEDTGERLKTVELVVQRSCQTPEAGRPGPRRRGLRARRAPRRKVALSIGWREKHLQGRVCQTFDCNSPPSHLPNGGPYETLPGETVAR